MTRSLTLLIATILASLALASTAQAATIHAPLPGASVPRDQSLAFDWAWDDDEYWTASIVFTQVASGADPIWLGGNQPGRIRVTDSYGTGFGTSHATVNFANWPFTAGQWYWRLCNNVVGGEDDKCYFRGDPIPLTITPAAALPTDEDACFDFIDNDGDGKVDLDDMDRYPNPADENKECDQVKPKPAAKLSKSIRLICNTWISGEHRAIPRKAPRRCSIWRENWAHYQSLTWIKGRWSRWGKSTAYAAVTGVYNSGARWKMRLRAYRPRRNCEGNMVYTRVKTKNVKGGKRWYVTKPDTCPH